MLKTSAKILPTPTKLLLLMCLFGVVEGFVPTILVIINTLAWGLFGKAVKVE